MAMSERNAAGGWIPLMDYAMKNGVSLSTLRRYIKAGKVQYKVEGGRYLLLDSQHPIPSNGHDSDNDIRKLEQDLKRAQEEIAELKMLVALYEEKLPPPRLLDC